MSIMDKRLIRVLCCLVATVILAESCSTTFYVPNQAIIAGLEEKGDFTSSFAMGDVRYGTVIGAQLDIGYAISDKVGIVGGTALAEDLYSLSSISRRTLGAGYNHKVDEGKFFRAYVISDFGEVESSELPELEAHFASYFGVSVLSSLSKKTSFGEFSLGLGLKRLSYNNITDNEDMDYEDFVYLKNHRKSFLIEPHAALFIGKRDLKFFMQLNQSLNLSHRDFPMKNAYFSLGVRWDLKL